MLEYSLFISKYLAKYLVYVLFKKKSLKSDVATTLYPDHTVFGNVIFNVRLFMSINGWTLFFAGRSRERGSFFPSLLLRSTRCEEAGGIF